MAVVTKFNPKIVLLGSGMIGGTLALLAGLKKFSSNIVLLDIVDGIPQGKALDISQALTCENVCCSVGASSDITELSEGLREADVVIVTAGFPRKPGLSREDLLSRNADVIASAGRAIKAQCPGAFVICVTNPLDVMVAVLQKASGLPSNRVVGMAGILDTSRFRYFLAQELKVSPTNVASMVIGGHGDEMVPLKNYTSIAGVPLRTMIQMGRITEDKVDEIIKRTRNGGGEIVAFLKMGSAFVAPACCALEMVESYLKDEKKILPACVQLGKEYGGKMEGAYFGVPAIIGANGVEGILEVPLEPKEQHLVDKSMEAVTATRGLCKSLGYDL